MRTLNKIALILCIIGGINWGSIGFFQFDIVAWMFGGQDSMLSRVIYVIVGIAAIWCISFIFRDDDLNDSPRQDNNVTDVGIR